MEKLKPKEIVEENEEAVMENPHQHNINQQMVGVDLTFFTQLLQMKTDYERLINVIIDNLELDYNNKLRTKSNVKILDYLKLTNPEIEIVLQERYNELKNEEEED